MKEWLDKRIDRLAADLERDERALAGYRETIGHLGEKIRVDTRVRTILVALRDSWKPRSPDRDDYVYVIEGDERVALHELRPEDGAAPPYRVVSRGAIVTGPACCKCRQGTLRIEHEHVIAQTPRCVATDRLLLCTNCPRVEPDPTERAEPRLRPYERVTTASHPQ